MNEEKRQRKKSRKERTANDLWLPAGFVFYDLANETVSDLDAERGAEFLGMPESLFTFECEEPLLDYGSVPEDETAFDPVIESAEPDPDRYHIYLREMLPTARPLSRKFYRWFMYSV